MDITYKKNNNKKYKLLKMISLLCQRIYSSQYSQGFLLQVLQTALNKS